MEDKKCISFFLNGQEHIVPNNVHPATRLVDYIRDVAQLKGTKVTCREGGCGVCVVTVQYTDHVTNEEKTRAINSCLCPISITRGWKITTTEGLGGKQNGFHPIHERMAEHSATQCGFCTPGFVMSMYGLLKEKPSPSCDDVIKSMDGNLCRCTGYRSIVDAAKSFSIDGDNSKPVDIEDLEKLQCVKKQICHRNVPRNSPNVFKNWQRPQTLMELYGLLDANDKKNVRLVFGNTATGVHKKDRYDIYLDIRNIQQLYKIQADDSVLELGANLTLTELQETFRKYKNKKGFGYLEKLADHIGFVGNTPVRNAGCWAGNVMMQHKHPEFLSDLIPPLEALGAKLLIGSKSGERSISVENLLAEDMKTSVILSVRLPALGDNEVFSVYKVMPRRQDAHAYVTSGFKVTFTDAKSFVVKEASFVTGGLNPTKKHHFPKIESYLVGKRLTDEQLQTECLKMVASDSNVSEMGVFPVKYREQLAQNLMYKFFSQFGENGRYPPVPRLVRPPATGRQDYETLPQKYPITQPMPKISATMQASGEVVYLDDLPTLPNELAALLVLSTIGKGNIDVIDTSAALAVPGVVDVVTAANISGTNLLYPIQLLAEDEIEYNGQPLAIVLADDLGIAYRGASMVRVTYKNVQKPVTDIEEAINKGYIIRETDPLRVGDTDSAMKKCKRVIEGTVKHDYQYHFYVENQGCLVAPCEDGFEAWASTQDTDHTQLAISEVLNVTASSVHVIAPRVGGAFGGKTYNSVYIAALTALGVAKTNRPVRMSTSLETSMKATGHRPDFMATYKVGVDEHGMIQATEITAYWNVGHREGPVQIILLDMVTNHSDGMYHFPNMLAKGAMVKTDTQVSSAMRSPGHMLGHMIVDQMMEHVAEVLEVDPVMFKQKHLCKQGQMMICGSPMPVDHVQQLWDDVIKSSDLVKRQKDIETFNKEHKWVKRGLDICPAKFLVKYYRQFTYTAYLAVYKHDASVVISHGGVEFGQGLNTKVAQVAMHVLGIPQDLIKFVRTNTLTAPNTAVSAGSMPSEYLCRTVQVCCESLLAKLAPIKQKHPGADWKTLIEEAHNEGVHLAVAEKYFSPTWKDLDYVVLGACVAEAEVDVLTGESQILRADVHMDIGQSVNPEIDVGQVEGALITGLGMMLYEREITHPETGDLLTASTWEYKPPTASDIPADFRVSFMKGKPNTMGVYSSKALGEPPMCMSHVFLHAVKAAVAASRKERDRTARFELYAPATPDAILEACDVTCDDLVYPQTRL